MTDQAAQIHLAEQLYRQKAYRRVITICESFVTKQSLTQSAARDIHKLMGKSYYKLSNNAKAIQHLKVALGYAPTDDNLHYYLGIAYLAVMQYHLAKQCFENALDGDPKEQRYYINLGATLRRLNQPERAAQCYRHLLKYHPTSTKGYRNLSLCVTYESSDHPDRFAIQKLLKKQKLSAEEKAQCYFALGKIYRDSHDLNAAMDCYANANYYKSKNQSFDPKGYSHRINTIIKAFPKERFSGIDSLTREITHPAPIFILGIPRSGKTLIESLICLSPSVMPLDEFGKLDKIVRQLCKNNHIQDPFQMTETLLTPQNLSLCASQYNKQVTMCGASRLQTVTDTTPCNFRYLGFITFLFPNAKIIHVIRNPFEQFLQIYFKYFSSGNYWAYTVEHIVHYYVTYRQLMRHWQQVCPNPILEIEYESLLCNPVKTIKQVFSQLSTELPSPTKQQAFIDTLHKGEIQLWDQYHAFFKHHQHHLDKLSVF